MRDGAMTGYSRLSAAIQAVVSAAQAMGHEVETIAEWSEATVAHMRAPLGAEQRRDLQTRFAGLRYFRTAGDPHNPPHEGFMDDVTKTAVSFPKS
jgi:hypothetical protein